MKLSTKLKDHLKAIDESATLYLTASSAILFDWQIGKIHRAIRETTDVAIYYRVRDFLRIYDVSELKKLSVEDNLFLVEQFEIVLHGKETEPPISATPSHSEEE